MNTRENTRKSLSIQSLTVAAATALTVSLLVVSLASAGHAAPLELTRVPAASAASRLSALYGVDIRLQRRTTRPVTLTLEDPGAADGRLAAVNALADAAGLEFTKCYVVSRAAGGRAVPPAVDSSAPLPLGAGPHPVREVIALVAGVDDATARVAGDVAGTVTLLAPPLTAGAAAAEVARQTGTSWRTVYVLAAPGQGPAGTAVGRAGGGGAITQLAYVYSVDPVKEAQTQRAAEAAQRRDDQERRAQEAAAYQEAMAQRAAVGGPLTGGGYYGGAYPSNFPASPYAATGAPGPANGTFTVSGMGY